MLLRKNLEVFCTGALPLLVGYEMPVYKQKDVEREFFFEQRYWLSAMKVRDIKDYQQRESRGIVDSIKRDFHWGGEEFFRPQCEQCTQKPLPVMMSSAGLLAWA